MNEKMPYKQARILHCLKEYGPVKPEKGEWRCRCPAHEDNGPSLYVGSNDERILARCNAGCTFEAVCEALDLTSVDFRIDEGDHYVVVDENLEIVQDAAVHPEIVVPAPTPAPILHADRDGIYRALL